MDRGNNATGISFVFRGQIISGQITPRQNEIASFRFFSPAEIEELIIGDLLYKPEYNLIGIRDWIRGESYPLGVIKHLGS